jgi:hypothetical protein
LRHSVEFIENNCKVRKAKHLFGRRNGKNLCALIVN